MHVSIHNDCIIVYYMFAICNDILDVLYRAIDTLKIKLELCSPEISFNMNTFSIASWK